jgi:hypothetical protein
MPYSKVEFDTSKQEQYKSAIASSAGTSSSNIDILSIAESIRRAGSVQVETKVRILTVQ